MQHCADAHPEPQTSVFDRWISGADFLIYEDPGRAAEPPRFRDSALQCKIPAWLESNRLIWIKLLHREKGLHWRHAKMPSLLDGYLPSPDRFRHPDSGDLRVTQPC